MKGTFPPIPFLLEYKPIVSFILLSGRENPRRTPRTARRSWTRSRSSSPPSTPTPGCRTPPRSSSGDCRSERDSSCRAETDGAAPGRTRPPSRPPRTSPTPPTLPSRSTPTLPTSPRTSRPCPRPPPRTTTVWTVSRRLRRSRPPRPRPRSPRPPPPSTEPRWRPSGKSFPWRTFSTRRMTTMQTNPRRS